MGYFISIVEVEKYYFPKLHDPILNQEVENIRKTAKRWTEDIEKRYKNNLCKRFC